MSSKEFTAWLSGFLEANSSKRLNEKQINQIKEKMKTIIDPIQYNWYYPWTLTGTTWIQPLNQPLDYTITVDNTGTGTNINLKDS